MENKLTLSEKLMLLAVRPEKGGYFSATAHAMDYTVLGACLLELHLCGIVKFDDKRMVVISSKTSLPLHEYLHQKISKSTRPHKPSYWMNSFSISKKYLRNEILASLVRKKEIRLEDRSFLFFKWKKAFLTPGHHVNNVIDTVKKVIMQGSESPEDIYLLSLIEPAQLLSRIYPDRSKRKIARLKIKQLKTSNQVSEAVKNAVQAAAAVGASVAIGAAVSSAASH